MKKTTAAIAAALILISFVFAACNGNNTGTVSDTSESGDLMTTIEDMMTEAATDLENLVTDNVSNNTNTSSDTNLSASDTTTVR